MSLIPIIPPSVEPVTITLTDSPVDPATSTAYTFSAAALGTAAVGRKIIVGISGRLSGAGTPGVATVTVDGNSATEAVTVVAGSGTQACSLWYVDLAVGTSGDIVVTFDQAQTGAGIGVWAVYNAAAGALSDTGEDESSGGVDGTFDITIPANGGLICKSNAIGTAPLFAWTNVTEQFDEDYNSGADVHSGAHDIFSALQTERTITCDQGVTVSCYVCGVAIARA